MTEAIKTPNKDFTGIITPEEIYSTFKLIYYAHLASHDDWDIYRNNSKSQRYNRNYFSERLVSKFRKLIDDSIFEKYPFFSQFNENYFFLKIKPILKFVYLFLYT